MTGVSLGGLTIEAANPPEVAAFWSRVLGGTMSNDARRNPALAARIGGVVGADLLGEEQIAPISG